MNRNLFENLKKDINLNNIVKNFMEELSNFLNKNTHTENSQQINLDNNMNLNTNRKEDHLYFVTEDRNNKVYLWDFTDKPKHEFVETNFSKELLEIAKEGTMLQYKNGKYELYSTDGYDMLENEKNN